jgi:pyruvate/2-oxoglutarate dehydrogenase complex dihydrolipoamide acyltransferase (E2) component
MSPRARRRARELLVPLQALGLPLPGQRISERDIEEAAAANARVDASREARRMAYEKGVVLHRVFAPGRRVDVSDVEVLPPAPLRLPAERVPLNPAHRAAAESMAYAQQFIPQFGVEALALAAPLQSLRERLQSDWGKRDAPSLACLFIRALGLLLSDDVFRSFRGVVDGPDVVYRGELAVGFTVALADGGSIAPVVRGLDRLGLRDLTRTVRDLTARARQKRLSAAESSGALLTLADLSASEVYSFRALVRPGESAVLALPAPHPRHVWAGSVPVSADSASRAAVPLYTDGGLFPEPMGQATVAVSWLLSLTADRRLVDEPLAVSFLTRLKSLVEVPEQLV